MTENEFIEIHEDLTFTGMKTKRFTVVKKKEGNLLGRIRWHGPWRQYCFFPETYTIFNTGCLFFITDFINKLMEEYKKKKVFSKGVSNKCL